MAWPSHKNRWGVSSLDAPLTFFWKSYSDNGIVGAWTREEPRQYSGTSGADGPISQSAGLQFEGSKAIPPKAFGGRERRGYKARSRRKGGQASPPPSGLSAVAKAMADKEDLEKTLFLLEKTKPTFCDQIFWGWKNCHCKRVVTAKKLRENGAFRVEKTKPK